MARTKKQTNIVVENKEPEVQVQCKPEIAYPDTIISDLEQLARAVDKLTLAICRIENRLNGMTGGYN